MERMEMKGQVEIRVCKEHKEPQENQEMMVKTGLKEMLELTEMLESREALENPGMATKVYPVMTVLMVILEQTVSPERTVL